MDTQYMFFCLGEDVFLYKHWHQIVSIQHSKVTWHHCHLQIASTWRITCHPCCAHSISKSSHKLQSDSVFPSWKDTNWNTSDSSCPVGSLTRAAPLQVALPECIVDFPPPLLWQHSWRHWMHWLQPMMHVPGGLRIGEATSGRDGKVIIVSSFKSPPKNPCNQPSPNQKISILVQRRSACFILFCLPKRTPNAPFIDSSSLASFISLHTTTWEKNKFDVALQFLP